MRLVFFFCAVYFVFLSFAKAEIKDNLFYLEVASEFNAQELAETVITLRNPLTNLSPSHIGQPGFSNLAFTYDCAIEALILKATGRQPQAEEILDYFSRRLKIPLKEASSYSDINNIYGILKIITSQPPSSKQLKSLVNAVDISCNRRQGKAAFEFWTTPGPISFLIFAMLNVNAVKYAQDAKMLGEALLAMQNSDGAICDGDRSTVKIHTEPHMDAFAAFVMLYQLDGEAKWKEAGERALSWFYKNVYHGRGLIDQGLSKGRTNDIFATDVYSLTMAGPAGNRFSLPEIKELTQTMLKNSLVRINLELPDGTKRTVILCDFANPTDSRVKQVRQRFRPMGSVEWTAQVILALQKNAVRFYSSGDKETAVFYKALSEALFRQTTKCFYALDCPRAKITFYATAQCLEVGPFGSGGDDSSGGWKTPFFYVKPQDPALPAIKGGSLIGAWLLLPYYGLNPFILGDKYKNIYNTIVIMKQDLAKAQDFLYRLTLGRNFEEKIPSETPAWENYIGEPALFNEKIWAAFAHAYGQRKLGNYVKAEIYFEQAIFWAKKVASNSSWLDLARRDNFIKNKEIGGIISYPWGCIYKDNDHYLHYAILRYPLLNEVATAMWALAAANFELGRREEAKYWIGRIITEVPLHQIADTTDNCGVDTGLVRGYWNALVSWEDNPGGYERDEEIRPLYFEVLKAKGLISAKPKLVVLNRN